MSEYVKFACERLGSDRPLAWFDGFAELSACRQKLLQRQLIGADAKGVGFGNVSIRSGTSNGFYVTGSATGGITELKPADCAKVVSYDFDENWILYEGSTIPSSESLTHGAIYRSDKNAGAVIHCHHLEFWKALLNGAPATSAVVEYGTPEMAHEIMRLFRDTDVRRKKILVMAGHEGGAIAFGKNPAEAFNVLINALAAEDSSSYNDSTI